MRLLSKKEQDSQSKKEEIRISKTLEKTISTLDAARRELNRFKTEEKAERERILRLHGDFMEQLKRDRDSLEPEIQKLEVRRRLALEPLDAIKKELDRYSQSLDGRSAQLDADIKALEAREKRISYQEGIVRDVTSRLDDREHSIVKKEKTLAETILEVNETLRLSRIALDEEKRNLESRSVEIATKQKSIMDTERGILRERETLSRMRDEIEKDRRHLESQQTSLRLAFEEAKKKGII